MEILVTGATGYIGGRLVPRLLEDGHRVRVLARNAGRLKGRAWSDSVDIHEADLLQPSASLDHAFQGADAAFYLVHSMSKSRDFTRCDREAAGNFVARAQSLRHVVYLGGLLPDHERVSGHLKSRAETGNILRQSLPVTEFQAGPIIGSGSASFEMVRYLTERLPAMIAPKWILNEVQPVAIRDVLSYLTQAVTKDPLGIVEIGADRLTFKRMMEVYAEVHGLRRIIVPVPVLAPTLAALWVGMVTPVPNKLAVPLVEGVVTPIVADTTKARAEFPNINPIPYRRAVELAQVRIDRRDVETRWSGALGSSDSTYELVDWQGLIREVRTRHVAAPPDRTFQAFSSLGGEKGWLTWEWAWKIRGMMDRAIGGPGLRRGRRDPLELLPGETVDFWRVEQVEPGRSLRLRAEMKVPGRAWLQWEAIPETDGSRLVQTAFFNPDGLWGVLYWNLLYPIHKFIFSDMVKAIAKDAEKQDDSPRQPPAGPAVNANLQAESPVQDDGCPPDKHEFSSCTPPNPA